MDSTEPKAFPNEVIKVRWDKFAPVYTLSDSSNQTFFYTLVNMLQVGQAKHILEIGCGAGKLIPYLLHLKSRQCDYFASDISDTMIDLAKLFLSEYIEKMGIRDDLDKWMERHHLIVQAVNGEDKIAVPYRFDRIICNLVLQITQNPHNMLQNLYELAQPGCLLGVSVWGEKSQHNFLTLKDQALTHLGRSLPQARSNFHLHNKLQQIAFETGWEVVVKWDQNAPYPYIGMQQNLKQLNDYSSLNDKDIIDFTEKKIEEIFAQKKILNFAAQLAILRRK